jgi:hypothetical protein
MTLMGVGSQAPRGSRRMGLCRWDGGSGRNFGQPAARAIEPVQDVDVRVKKSVAPSKRSLRYLFGIVRSDPHGGQNSPLWLTSSCEPGREAAPLPADRLARSGHSIVLTERGRPRPLARCRPVRPPS